MLHRKTQRQKELMRADPHNTNPPAGQNETLGKQQRAILLAIYEKGMRRKKPIVHYRAIVRSITQSSPLELEWIHFLHAESGSYR